MILTMAYFNRDSNNRSGRDNRGGGRGFSSGGRSSFGRGGGDERPREMFKTVCSNCGKDCEVPFRPTTGKPVYCSDCFEKMGGRSDRPDKSDRSDRPQAPRVDNSKQFSDLNTKLDKIIELLTPVVKTPKVKKEKVVKEIK